MRAVSTTSPILCLVTSGPRLARFAGASLAAADDLLVAQVRAAAAAGVDVVHVRERGRTDSSLARLVAAMVDARGAAVTRIIVNDRPDIALASCADGVHLREDSYPASAVRRFAPAAFIVGRSIHDPDDAAARDPGLDFVVFGSVFPTRSKPEGYPVAGLEGLRRAVRASRRPVLAIGGVNAETAAAVMWAGAAGLAAVDAFLPGASDLVRMQQIVERLRGSFAPAPHSSQ